jgi:hypothetical protein
MAPGRLEDENFFPPSGEEEEKYIATSTPFPFRETFIYIRRRFQ